MKCWLLIKTTRPASAPAILLTCSLAPQFSSSYFLIISPHSVSSVIPIVLCRRPPAVPAPSLTPFHRTSPPSSFSSFLPIPASFLIPSVLLPPLISPPPPPPRLPRLRSGERVGDKKKRKEKTEEDRDAAVSRLRQSCHQLGDLKACVSGSAPCQFTSSSHNQRKALTCTCRNHNHPTQGPPRSPPSLGLGVMEDAY